MPGNKARMPGYPGQDDQPERDIHREAVDVALPKSKTYEEFIEKFKPKITTDDCATLEPVYNAVLGWVVKEYGIDPKSVLRPFWPGLDYQQQEYPAGCVVVDNPPFSILAKICEWYLDRNIKFFLFAPSLTALSGKNVCMRMNHIICDADIVYENGANVRTAFVTNLGDGETVLQTAPSLGKAVNDAVKKIRKETVKQVPKYTYPWHIVTAALLQRYSKHGVELKIGKSECIIISKMDAQKDSGKAIFGGGLLLSDAAASRHEQAARAAAERAAAERAAAHVWELSQREMEIVKELNK